MARSRFGAERRFRARPWSRIALCLMLALAGGGHVQAVAQTPARAAPVKEYQLKAVFLFNFAQFVDWPTSAFADPQAPLDICVLGDDPFAPYLDDAVRDERVNNRPIVVHRYHKLSDAKACHILFVSKSEREHLDLILEDLRGRSVLTVSDIDGFATHDGMIQFVTEKNKIRLHINADVAKAANVTISSKLLRSAEIVTSGQE